MKSFASWFVSAIRPDRPEVCRLVLALAPLPEAARMRVRSQPPRYQVRPITLAEWMRRYA